MKIYLVNDQVQESLDSGNANSDTLHISRITKDTIICPINQSIPEKKFKTINCNVATSTRRAYAIGVADGDFCMTYNGDNRKEIKQKVLEYCYLATPELSDKPRGLIYEDGGIGIVYAPIRNGIEFCFYKGKTFNCNYEEFNKELNEKRADCNIDLEGLVDFLSKEFNAEVLNTLPEKRNPIKNRRGIIQSCSSGKNIFDVKKKDKTFRIKCPMVFDETQNANIPKTSLLGFGCLNNTDIKNGFYEGDLTIFYQEDELEETIKLFEEKGDVEWLDGQQ